MEVDRKALGDSPRWVIKIGSSLVTDAGRGLDHAAISNWAEQIASLREAGKDIVLVSSGAVAEGMQRLGWAKRPHAIHELQAAAAVGQMGLVQAYESIFMQHAIRSAQVLLSYEDLANRARYLNARSTISTLLELGVIPVVNENDTVATEEIRLGDNDTLAAMVTNLVVADLLIILTDQAGLYDKDPNQHPGARRIECAQANDPLLDQVAGPSNSQLGRGGMITKVEATRRAARSGAAVIIASGREPEILLRLAAGANLGTALLPGREPLAARKQWLANQLNVSGRVFLDAGAARVIQAAGKSLLPVGVTNVEGRFARGDVVACIDPDGREIARGLINYNMDETRKIMGKPSQEIETALGYVDEAELIHRDNLVVL